MYWYRITSCYFGYLIMQLLWFFGVHGFSIMWGLISVFMDANLLWNTFNCMRKHGSFDGITQVAPNTLVMFMP